MRTVRILALGVGGRDEVLVGGRDLDGVAGPKPSSFRRASSFAAARLSRLSSLPSPSQSVVDFMSAHGDFALDALLGVVGVGGTAEEARETDELVDLRSIKRGKSTVARCLARYSALASSDASAEDGSLRLDLRWCVADEGVGGGGISCDCSLLAAIRDAPNDGDNFGAFNS